MSASDRFTLIPYFKFLLLIRFLGPVAFMVIIIWAISTPYIELSEWGPLILLALAGWAIYEGLKLFKWFNFSITLHDNGLQFSSNELIPWEQFQSGWARQAFHFETFIELTTKSGKVIEIPAVIQKSSLVHSVIKKHIPNFEVKS